MKKILAIILTLVMILSLTGCSNNTGEKEPEQKEEQLEIVVPEATKLYKDSGLLCVQNSDGKWVFIDQTGKTVIETNYSKLLDQSKDTFESIGVGVFCNDDTWAVLDSSGKELAVFKNEGGVEYNIYGFYEGDVTLITRKISGGEGPAFAYGIIDKTGKLATDFIYDSDYAPRFSGDGYVIFQNAEGKYGLATITGEVVLEPTYDSDRDIPSFSKNGLAAKSEADKYGFTSWGYINTKGEWVIQPQFKSAGYFQDNDLALVKTPDGYGIIDKTGKLITTQAFDSITGYEHGVAVTVLDKQYGLINEKGEVVASGYKHIDVVNSQFAKVTKDDKKGYITLDGKVYLECGFEDLGSVGANGLTAAKKDGKWGYVNKTGSWVIDPIFSRAETFGKNGYAVVALDGKYGLINDKGEYKIEPLYKDVLNYNVNGIAAVKVNRSWEFINQEGQTVGSTPFEAMWCYPGDGFFVTQDMSDGYIKYVIIKDGKVIASDLPQMVGR